ncbi:hypothetical protein [Azospirillum doebereinerae]|uniref:hypothetical protein n=1 Tax=Azospirillum doebereinerae TaxID=92933 RepID=UPI003B75C221
MGWRRVTDEVHEAGGRIVAQLWHMGRVVHLSFLGGAQPVSSSVTTAPGHAHTYQGKQPYTASRALRVDEIPSILADSPRPPGTSVRPGSTGCRSTARTAA